MSDPNRVRRLADRIRAVVAETLGAGRIKDPRLGFVTITEVRVTGDLQHATVFYTVFGDAEARAETAAALASARGLLRTQVGRATGLRLTPTLEFVLDELPEGATHLEDVLREARERDAAVAALAATATYAGDPDPYRHPEDEDEDDGETPAGPADSAGPAGPEGDPAAPPPPGDQPE